MLGTTLVGWLVVCYVPSTARGHSHLLSLAKDVKLGFYTVPTGNRVACTEPLAKPAFAKRQRKGVSFKS